MTLLKRRHRRTDDDGYLHPPEPAVPNKIAVGPTSVAGWTVSATAFAAAILAFTTGDHSEQTLGTIIAGAVGLVAFAITQVGRYRQANTAVANTPMPPVAITNHYADTEDRWEGDGSDEDAVKDFDPVAERIEELQREVERLQKREKARELEAVEAINAGVSHKMTGSGLLASSIHAGNLAFAGDAKSYSVAGSDDSGPTIEDLGADHPLPGMTPDESLDPGQEVFEVPSIDMRHEQADYHQAFEGQPRAAAPVAPAAQPIGE